VNATTPWFEAYRRMFFEQSRQSDHEFLFHYVACILVVSSSHPNPIEGFANLYQKHVEMKNANKYPKYVPHPHLFYYRLLVHDVATGDEQRAQKLQQELSVKYGIGQSSVLKINSRKMSSVEDSGQAPEADPWSQYLINMDTNQEEDSVESDEDDNPDPSKIYSTPPSLSTSSLKKQPAKLPPVPSEPRLDLLNDDPLASESISDPLSSDPLSEANDPLTQALHDSELGTVSDNSSKSISQTDIPSGAPSRVPSVKVLHGQCLTLNDQERIRNFVNDFCNRGLLPFLEKQIRQLNEQVNSKRGFQRALFRVGRNWFGGGNKPSNHSGVTSYSIESGELQMRLLGDLAFLCQNYELAYTCYHSCKRDFQNDHAWLYYAGALEMAATSLFMQISNRRDPHPYFEESIQVYTDTCKLSHYATRATLLATEMMKTRLLYRAAAAAFIKITSEDSDLKSALMLEQAAHCFLRMSPQSIRKFAFHLILAGHRYSKSFQRRHALRTYGQALEFYQEKSWSLAEDHINFSLGHQSFTLKQLEDAYVAFHRLLSHSWNLQQPKQQNTHLKEFLYVFKQHLINIGLGNASATTEVSDGPIPFLSSVKATADLPVLPLPAVVAQQTQVLVSCVAGYHEQLLPNSPSSFRNHSLVGNGEKGDRDSSVIKAGFLSFDRLDDSSVSMDEWRQLEQLAMNGSSNSNPSVEFIPCLQTYFDENTDNTTEPVCVVGERVDVQLSLQNPLQVDLCLGKLTLLWEHNSPDDSMPNETPPDLFTPVVTEVLDELTIAPGSTEQLQLSLTPLAVGTVSIVGIAYNLKARSNEYDDENDEVDVGLLQRRDRKSNVRRMLNVGIRGKQLVHCRGVRLNRDKKEKSSVVYGPDKRLHLKIIPAMPQLEVTFVNFPTSLLCGEVKVVKTTFSNKGKKPLKNLRITSSHNRFFAFGGVVKNCESTASVKTSGESSEDKTSLTDNEAHGHPVALQVPAVTNIQLPNNQLSGGDSITVCMWVHGGEEPGVQEVNFLFYYEPVESDSYLRHRVLRHTTQISLASSLRLNASAELSLKNTHECSRIDKAIQEVLLTLDIDNVVQVMLCLLILIAMLYYCNCIVINRYLRKRQQILSLGKYHV
jgi:tetratricopeptide (TPR) repeat protein